MFGILGKLGKVVFGGDPLPKAPPPAQPPRPDGLYLPDVQEHFGYKPMSPHDIYTPRSGFGHGYKQFQHQSSMDAPFAAQWQSGPTGPQWVEPVRTSSNSWDSRVATGPFKGNRI